MALATLVGAGAIAEPDGGADAATILCHGSQNHKPAHHRHLAELAIVQASVAALQSLAAPGGAPDLPAPSAGPAHRASLAQPRAPPTHTARAFYPRGPPFIA